MLAAARDATAIFIDRLNGGATDFTALYAATGALPLARKVEALVSSHDGGPGGEYDLVESGRGNDRSPQVVRLEPGPRHLHPCASEPAGGGVIYAPGPKARSAAAVPLLLAALRRFDAMEEPRILALIREIGERAETGISYTDDTATLRVESLPGEEFTGLGMMCLLYAPPGGTPPGRRRSCWPWAWAW